MTARGKPHDQDEGRARGPANTSRAVTQPPSTPALTKTGSRSQFNRPGRQCGRYGAGWRAGFRAGAADALRVAAREVDDPTVWAVLDRLADEYELAGGDQ